MNVATLVEHIRDGRFGDYHTIWYSLARRASLGEAAWILLDVLESKAPYLARYHCAAALLKLMQCTDFEPVALSAGSFPVARNLAEVRSRVEARIGARR